MTIDSCRIKILEELLETESTYVTQLEILNNDIVVPTIENELLPEDEIRNVFINVQDILAFNQVFLTDIRGRVTASIKSPETELSDIFLSRVR